MSVVLVWLWKMMLRLLLMVKLRMVGMVMKRLLLLLLHVRDVDRSARSRSHWTSEMDTSGTTHCEHIWCCHVWMTAVIESQRPGDTLLLEWTS